MASNEGQLVTENEMNDPENKKLVHEGWTTIKDKQRGCTDVLFFLILLCSWFAMTIIGLIVTGRITSSTLSMGNPYRLINAVDYTNHICGYDNGVSNLQYGYYLPDKSAVCVSKCPTAQSFTSFICHYDLQQAVDNDKSGLLGFYYLSREQCMYKLQTSVVLNRCVPTVATNAAALAFSTHFNLTGSNATIVKNTAYPSTSSSARYHTLTTLPHTPSQHSLLPLATLLFHPLNTPFYLPSQHYLLHALSTLPHTPSQHSLIHLLNTPFPPSRNSCLQLYQSVLAGRSRVN